MTTYAVTTVYAVAFVMACILWWRGIFRMSTLMLVVLVLGIAATTYVAGQQNTAALKRASAESCVDRRKIQTVINDFHSNLRSLLISSRRRLRVIVKTENKSSAVYKANKKQLVTLNELLSSIKLVEISDCNFVVRHTND